jgi:hypothetical protein
VVIRVWHLAVGAVCAVALGGVSVMLLQHPRANGVGAGFQSTVKVQMMAGGGSGQAGSSTRYSAAVLLSRLRANGMPIGSFVNYTVRTDENHLLGRPGEYISKVNFQDTRIPAAETDGDPTSIDAGGSIETFASSSDAQRRLDYVKSVTQSFQAFAEYEYLVGGTVLLRLSNVLTPAEAAAYRRALQSAIAS